MQELQVLSGLIRTVYCCGEGCKFIDRDMAKALEDRSGNLQPLRECSIQEWINGIWEVRSASAYL